MRILNEEQEILLKDERSALADLQQALIRFGVSPDDQETMNQSIRQIDDLFMLVVVGEFNSGKSSFINALVGSKLLKEGVTPTTAEINTLRYAETPQDEASNASSYLITAPLDLLKEISIVDTPGTNAIIRKHEEITSHFIPQSDLVLFVTSSDRPFTESERAFLERIRDWGKKLVIVLNKIDILQSTDEIEQIKLFIQDNARGLLGITPEIFPVSSRKALLAKQGQPELWEQSRFEVLENFIHSTLDEKGRVQLKFLNPIGVALHLTDQYLNIIAERINLLAEDIVMLDNVDRQLEQYKSDMLSDFEFRMSDIKNVLFEMEQRGQAYFEETLRVARILDLLNKDKIQSDFEHRVIKDVPQQLDRKVNELIDWMVERDFQQWEAVMNHLAERRRHHQKQIIGDPGTASFNYDRERLIEAVGKEAGQVVKGYDKTREAQLIASGAQAAVAATAAMEVGAIGLGAAITAIATTMAADVTGVLLASLVAVLGLFVIPAKRRKANQEMNQKISLMRDQLINSLTGHFEREIERSLGHIRTAISPYTRFIRSENNRLLDAKTELQSLQKNLESIKKRVESL